MNPNRNNEVKLSVLALADQNAPFRLALNWQSPAGVVVADDRIPTRLPLRDLVGKLRRREPVLFCAYSEYALERGGEPGPGTLFAPRSPQAYLAALLSARYLVSFDLALARVGSQNGVPTLFITDDEVSANAARAFGISVGDICPQTIDDFAANVPRRAPPLRTAETALPLNVACIADRHYLPYFVGLVENLRQVHQGPLRIHLLALDDYVADFFRDKAVPFDLTVHETAELWTEEELWQLLRRPMAPRAYTCKSRLLRKVLRMRNEPVFYYDLDIFFYRSPVHLVSALDKKNVLIFPTFNDELSDARIYGAADGGALLVKPGSERFLEWWAQLCLERCHFRPATDYFVDQGYLDLAPIYFDDVGIYRGGDESISIWHARTLNVHYPSDRPWQPRTRAGDAGSLHAAKVDQLGIFETKFGWDQVCHFFNPVDLVSDHSPLFSDTILQQKNHWPRMKRAYYVHFYLSEKAKLPGWAPTRRFFQKWMWGVRGALLSLVARRKARSIPLGQPSHWSRLQTRMLFPATREV